MKMLISLATILSTLSFAALAQNIDVKGVDTSGNEPTTIKIEKGANTTAKKAKHWEVRESTDTIEGDAGATAKDGKENWKKACADWIKGVKADNQDPKAFDVKCGSSQCSGDAGNKICTSQGSYKTRILMDEVEE